MDEKKCEENMLKRREMFVNTDENYWSYKGFVFFIVSYFVVPFLLILMPCVCHGLCVFHLQQCWSVPKLFGSFVFVIFLSFMTDRQCSKKLHQTDFDSHMLLFTLIFLICSVSFWRYSAN